MFVEKAKKTKASGRHKSAAKPARKLERERALSVLMKFRLIINSAKRQFKWIENQCGINGAQLWVLWEIQQAQGLRVNELATAMAMHQSTVSNLIDKLSRATLITRERATGDQRVVTLHLTESGKALLKRAPKPARGILPEALFSLSGNALATLDKLLEQVLHEMGSTDMASMKKPLAELLAGK